MDANVPYEIIKFAAAKNQQGYITPDQYNLIINQAQRGFLDYLLGEYQRYQIQRPVAVVEFGQNERIRQSLAPLIYGTVLYINPATGQAPFPSDHEYPDAMWGLYGFYNIRFIQQDRQDAYLHSAIDPIATNPVYLINHEGFQFFPNSMGSARMSYVRTPPTIKWAYVTINDEPIYDPINSISPVWSESDMMQIIVRALQLVGCNLQLGVVAQYANDIKNNGQ